MGYPPALKTPRARPARRFPWSALILAWAGVALASCGGGGGSGSKVPGFTGGQPELALVNYGLLADVYGLRPVPGGGTTIDLYQSDVLVGPNIEDERPPGSTKPDPDITYDFLTADPDTLQPRLLITRNIGSPEFAAAFDALDDEARLVQPAEFGQNTNSQPFSLVARNAALRLTFTHDLGLTEDFFVERGPNGNIIGQKNTEAVQLLEITGDPNDPDPTGDFRLIPIRIVPRGNVLIIDPVLLGSEGLRYQTRNNAAGMPESPNQVGANMRLAIALEGPLAIPGIRPNPAGGLTGNNNSGQMSVIRDFRSGNRNDNTPEISQGFLRDPVSPNLVGEIVMYLENVSPGPDAATKVLTIYKNNISHELDRGDVVRLIVDNTGIPVAVSEITIDPSDDAGNPGVQHVRAVVRKVVGPNGEDVFEQYDPSNQPGYPQNVSQREPWLVQNAPKTVILAEFTAETRDPNGMVVMKDDPKLFVTFTPQGLPLANGSPSPSNENISPFAGAIVRFSKPVDLSTVSALDSFFFATRNLFDQGEITAFKATLPPGQVFNEAKYRTPYLVGAQVFDEDGSQTSLRLVPLMGFYLDDQMRQEDGPPVPFSQRKYNYFLHLLGGQTGIRDLAGNPIDFQSITALQDIVIEFGLDLRSTNNRPNYPDNRTVTIARRFADADEDEQPSYSDSMELANYPLPDVFGGVITNGMAVGRPTTRVRRVVDDLNQQAAPPQPTSANQPNPDPQRWCPAAINNETQIASPTAQTRFGMPLQNPLNPFGCRLQTVWREIDMNLSKTDPLDFDLDVEQMYWAPFTAAQIVFDEFDRVSLFLGHSEWRPEPCVGSVMALPSLFNSGLGGSLPQNQVQFDDDYVFNPTLVGVGKENPPTMHTAYADATMTILPSQAITEPNGVYKYLPLPTFQKPYFVWRDERVMEQGANSQVGFDNRSASTSNNYGPYILSPFESGHGSYTAGNQIQATYWDNRDNYMLPNSSRRDPYTGGLVGSIALPLLADFWTYPDDPTKPVGNPFRASGANGWQISLAVTSSPLPAFRVYSAGGLVNSKPQTVDPSQQAWTTPSGGYNTGGAKTVPADNSVFWVMSDFLKRVSVMTSGFVDIIDPHRIKAPSAIDPRLGPYYPLDINSGAASLPPNVLPNFDWASEPPLQTLPGGTSITPEFRAAGPVDNSPWWAVANGLTGSDVPNWKNVPLDPFKAGDAHIRKYDERGGRNGWTYYYQKNVTDYVTDPNKLTDPLFVSQFAAPNETFLPNNIRYFNWRLVFQNNVDANPPISPQIDSFMVVYRFDQN